MKKIFNKKKAFTLVELLAVVAIIAVIAMLIAPSIIKTINGSKQDAYDLQVTRMEASAQNFVSDKRKTITELKTIGTPYDVTLQTLSDAGYIDLPLINPLTGENFNPNTTLVTITKQTNGSYTYEFAIGNSNNPTLVLLGSNPDTIVCAASGNYTDPQADVTDPLNPGAANINATTTLSKKNAGSHMLLYSYTSSLPKTVTKTRTVNITNANTPTITIAGNPTTITINEGDSFTAPAATASDVCEGAITVNVSSNVVTTVPGDYAVTYAASNTGGITKTSIVTVHVLSVSVDAIFNFNTIGEVTNNFTQNLGTGATQTITSGKLYFANTAHDIPNNLSTNFLFGKFIKRVDFIMSNSATSSAVNYHYPDFTIGMVNSSGILIDDIRLEIIWAYTYSPEWMYNYQGQIVLEELDLANHTIMEAVPTREINTYNTYTLIDNENGTIGFQLNGGTIRTFTLSNSSYHLGDHFYLSPISGWYNDYINSNLDYIKITYKP